MTIHNNNISIYFGDSSDQLYMHEQYYTQLSILPSLLAVEPFTTIGKNLQLTDLICARQVHGSRVHAITSEQRDSHRSFTFEGDALITNQTHIGIGILTADCLPIVIHDTVHHAIATVHAGWRSSVQQIASKTLACMHKTYGTQPTDVKIYFGPSAGPCCYQVGNQLINTLGYYRKKTIQVRDGLSYFDNRLYNQIVLQTCDVPDDAFCSEYALCTICNHQFWSYRRQQDQAGRQITIAALK